MSKLVVDNEYRNLETIRQWVQFYNNLGTTIAKQLVSQLQYIDNEIIDGFFKIPWGHHILILQKIKERNEAAFYIRKTIENNWSRSVLEYQIETNLYNRQGKAITNFEYIGILLCKNKDNYEVEFSLKDIHNPIGVSEYRYTELPENIRKSLPTLEQLTTELNNIVIDEN
jgi:predicted nuclease of restriction endonuclease-like (RecB) superfamily